MVLGWNGISNLGVEQGTEHLTVLIQVLNTWHTWHIIHILLHLMFFDKLLTDQAILSSCIGTTFLCQRFSFVIYHVFLNFILYIFWYIIGTTFLCQRWKKKTRIILYVKYIFCKNIYFMLIFFLFYCHVIYHVIFLFFRWYFIRNISIQDV